MADVNQCPLVREGTFCVACTTDGKPKGLLVHWSCHNTLKMIHEGSYGKRVEALLAELEVKLEKEQRK